MIRPGKRLEILTVVRSPILSGKNACKDPELWLGVAAFPAQIPWLGQEHVRPRWDAIVRGSYMR